LSILAQDAGCDDAIVVYVGRSGQNRARRPPSSPRRAFLALRTIGETPTSRPMGYAPIGICFAVCMLLIRGSSSYVSGHGLLKSSSKKG